MRSVLPLRVCIYKDKDFKSMFIAHCLELNVIGDGESVEEAVSNLLEAIEVQIEACRENGSELLFPAPPRVVRMYINARKAGRKLCGELVERIVASANKRLGHELPDFDDVLYSSTVPPIEPASC